MRYLKKDVLRLAATYLAIIMVMSVGFSIVFYHTTLYELGHRPADGLFGDVQLNAMQSFSDYLDTRAIETQATILADIFIVNILTLFFGAILSFLLAEYTLRPIERNMESQTQFVSDASHELRTPLTALRAANEVALRNKKLTVKEARTVMEGNIQDIARLQHLADSMLGLLSGDDAKIRSQMSLSQLVGDALQLVVPQAQAKNVSVEDMVDDVTVRVNPSGFIQLLTILVDNAVKYSADDSTVIVSSDVRSRTVRISVRDEGVGMSSETIKRIFTRFYRAEESRNTNGHGLGLTIAKKIADAHGARINVKSQVGKGSTFTVILPI